MSVRVLLAIVTGFLIFGGFSNLLVDTDQVFQYGMHESRASITPVQSNITIPVNESNAVPPIVKDLIPPIVRIVEPGWCSPVKTGNIVVRGTSLDNGSGIKIVEVHVDKNKYSTAVPENITDWSSWSITIKVDDTQPHRIQARATDNSGNQNWDDITINTPLVIGKFFPAVAAVNGEENRVAFVEPTFTNAAYSDDHFYAFYGLWERATDEGDKVTMNVDKLTAGVPQEPDREYFLNFTKHVNEFDPNANVSIIRDEDVHNGYIFGPDGSNAYDVLFLLHDEYVSDQGYNNFKRFVSNGGTIVFLDGNMFYAQVRYDPKMCTVTLVKGHDWDFDGKVAVKSDHEAYFEDKKEWVGSNFLYGDIAEPVRFLDNPFNYTRFEENYVSNPNATILYDYGAQIPESVLNDNDKAVDYPKIATYELNYGKGKVITLGLYAQNLAGNEAFMNFFDRIILPRALGQPFKFDTAGQNETVPYWWMNTGKLSGINVDNQSNTVILNLERSEQREDTLFTILPSEITGGGDPKLREFNVTVNDKEVDYNQTPDDIENGFEIPLSANATKVQISVIGNNTDLGLDLGTESLSKSIQNGSVLARADNASSAPKIQIVEGAYSVTSTEFFRPSTVSISPGTAVSWTNDDIETHTITSGSLESGGPTGTLFDSGFLAPGKMYEHAFTDKGIFDYFCNLHPFMKGTVIVK
jgi:plastocyanin